MESERSPLAGRSQPRYTFLGSGDQLPKINYKKLQCCICGTIIALLLIAFAVILSLYLNTDYSSKSLLNNSEILSSLRRLNWPLPEEHYPQQILSDPNTQLRAFQAGVKSLRDRESLEEHFPTLGIDTPAFRHQLATHTSKEAQNISKLGFVLNWATKDINECFYNNTNWKCRFENPKKWIIDRSSNWIPEVCLKNMTLQCTNSPYRTADGTCNNLKVDRTWGAALQPFRRILLPKYEDGISEPRRASDGSPLPSAREVSLAIHRPVYVNDANFTVMLAVWGQFIDHDITATAISKGKDGAPLSCCTQEIQHPECFPVLVNQSDPYFQKYNVTCMEFVRSAPAPVCAFGPREQLNQATSFLDGSVVYGNNDEVMNQLRTFQGGELKMLKTPSGELLPISDDPNDGCNREEEFRRGRYCFLSGDARSNENLLITSMHLLFARLHNEIARELAKINPEWKDERIFQEARKIVGAQIQHITYTEFLPSILPLELMRDLNMSTKDFRYSDHYNSSVNPSIANAFASAAFRFGHTLLPGLIQFLHKNASHEEYLELHKMLFNPFELYDKKFLEKFMRSVLNTSTEKADVYFNKEVTQKLFQRDQQSFGLDLVSLNIQRGRDHGLPSYPNWRVVCGMNRPASFKDLEGEFDKDTLINVQKLYKSVEDLDLYTGALAEIPVNGGLLGPTLTCLLTDQFLRLKIGDRFWYETEDKSHKFTYGQLNEIRKTTLAKIICKTSEVSQSQPRVMHRVGINNEMKSCDDFEYPNLYLWRET